MPTIIVLFGINIAMYQISKEHGKPHIHAQYGDYSGVFLIENGEMIEGNLKPKQEKNVSSFIKSYKNDLLEMWNTANIKQIKI